MTQVIIDAANVVGSKPDGWWRDRVGANKALRDALPAIKTDGFDDIPGPLDDVVLVVEGQAKNVPSSAEIHVESASGIGDDKIVELLDEKDADYGERVVVVTSDRELRDRVTEKGAESRGSATVPRTPADVLRSARPGDMGMEAGSATKEDGSQAESFKPSKTHPEKRGGNHTETTSDGSE